MPPSSIDLRALLELVDARAAPPPSPLPTDKAAWRAALSALLRGRDHGGRRLHADRLARDVVRLAQAVGARVVGLYSPLGAEVDTRPLANALAVAGIETAWPRVRGAGPELDFALASGPAALQPRPRSRLLEPVGPPIDPNLLDVVVVPTVGVRPDGPRLGRGGGSYDRYLPGLRDDAICIAAAPCACVVDWFPNADHDALMHLVATEDGLWACLAESP